MDSKNIIYKNASPGPTTTMKEYPFCKKCGYIMLKTNYQEYFCSKCGNIGIPEYDVADSHVLNKKRGLI